MVECEVVSAGDEQRNGPRPPFPCEEMVLRGLNPHICSNMDTVTRGDGAHNGGIVGLTARRPGGHNLDLKGPAPVADISPLLRTENSGISGLIRQ